MANIRHATVSDVPRLVELGAVMHAESRFARYPFRPERVRQMLQTLLAMPMGLVIVAEVDGLVVGGIAAVAVEHFACDFVQASDVSVFIAPEHRGGTTVGRLVRRYRMWATDIGAAEANIQHSTGVELERAGRLFEALGAQKTGATWTWREPCA